MSGESLYALETLRDGRVVLRGMVGGVVFHSEAEARAWAKGRADELGMTATFKRVKGTHGKGTR